MATRERLGNGPLVTMLERARNIVQVETRERRFEEG
jgi:hypothetical protein